MGYNLGKVKNHSREKRDMDTRILSEIGLTNGEIKVYLALLKLGLSSTGPLAKESQVSRSKLYVSILDKLEKKGLVSHVEKNGVMYFQAADTVRIKDYLYEKEKKLKQLEEEFDSFIPKLNAYQQDVGKINKVSIYQGLQGLITAHSHTYLKLRKRETYYCIGIPSSQPESQILRWQVDHARRVRAGIKAKLLFNKDVPPTLLKTRNSYRGCDARYMPIDLHTPAYFEIYADTVFIAIPSENPVTIEIISQEIADSFMVYFNEFWKVSRPFEWKRRIEQKQ